MKPDELKTDKTNLKQPYEKPKMVIEKIELATVAGQYPPDPDQVVNGKYSLSGGPPQALFGTCGG
jgi:hypothetical protein